MTGWLRTVHRARGPLFAAGGVAAATLALWLRDPHQHASWGLCPFKLLTGWDCPACGGLRAVNDLTHAQLLAAWHSNALFVSALPVLVSAWAWWLLRSVRGPRPGASRRQPRARVRTTLAVAGFGVILAFTVWRNTPWGTGFHVA